MKLILTTNKQKGFTLIELLIVVAIIGILAAIGATVIPGMLGKSKATVVQQNHETVLAFISASLIKCSIGDELKLKTWNTWGTFFDTPDLCNVSNSKLAAGFVNHFTAIGFKNPYVNINHPYSAVVSNPSSCQGADLGYICIIVSNAEIKIKTEWKDNEYLQNVFQR